MRAFNKKIMLKVGLMCSSYDRVQIKGFLQINIRSMPLQKALFQGL